MNASQVKVSNDHYLTITVPSAMVNDYQNDLVRIVIKRYDEHGDFEGLKQGYGKWGEDSQTEDTIYGITWVGLR